jgi:Transport protein particle (TRAPP) component
MIDDNPLAEFVELPEEAIEGWLWFSNVLCGVLRGALEMVRTWVSLTFSVIPLCADVENIGRAGAVHRSRVTTTHCQWEFCP